MPRIVRWFGEGSATTALAVGLGGFMICNGIANIVRAYKGEISVRDVEVPAGAEPVAESAAEPAPVAEAEPAPATAARDHISRRGKHGFF